MSKIYLEILDQSRKEVFEKLKAFSLGYLAGGTALALQIKHRFSYDFDIFFQKSLNRSIVNQTKKLFGQDFQLIRRTSDQITLITPNQVKLDFVHYWYKPLKNLVVTKSIPLASVVDIGADKALSIGRRATWRDYFDIFFLLKNKFTSLEKLIKSAQQKFGGEFNELLFLEQLVFFQDLPIVKIDFLEKKYSSAQIKKYLEKEVKQYLK